MAVSRRASTLPLLVGSIALLAPVLAAQEIYTTNGSNGRILRLDFAAGTTTTVTQESSRKFKGLALRDDGGASIHLVTADSASNAVLFYPNAQGTGQVITTQVPGPDGPSVDSAGNLYLVSAGTRYAAPAVWKIPHTGCGGCVGGYGTPQVLDGATGSTGLVDTLVVRAAAGSLAVGDLLVLSRSPARVTRYPGGAGSPVSFIATIPGKGTPTGFAITPGNELLIATTAGSVLRYNASGGALSPAFASGLGKGTYKITAGMQFGAPRAFIASRNAGTVVRYEIQSGGTGAPDGSLAGQIQTPNGVAMTPFASVVTPVGCPVTIQPLPEFELTFDCVVAPGFTTASIITFQDNREGDVDQNLHDFLGEGEHPELPDVVVPGYVHALPSFDPDVDPPGGPGTGPDTFMLAVIDTSVVFEDTAVFHGFEDVRLGWQPPCGNSAPYDQEPRTFYAPEIAKGEAPIQEGNVFADISVNCGSNKGGGWSFSLYLTGRDTRTVPEIIAAKMATFAQVIQAFFDQGFYPASTHDALVGRLDNVSNALAVNDFLRASDELGDIVDEVHAREATIDNSTRNVGGEIIARARSLKFFVCKGQSDFDGCLALH